MENQPGKMGMAEGTGLAFIATVPLVFSNTPSLTVERLGGIGWLTPLLTDLFVIIVLFLLARIFQSIPGDIIHMTQVLYGRLAAKLACLYYLAAFLALSVFGIRELSENTLLTALPKLNFHAAVFWYSLGAAVIAYAGIENLCRAAYFVMPFLAGALLTSLIALYPFYEVNYLFPWQGHGLTPLLGLSFLLTGAQFGAMTLAILAPSFQNSQNLKAAAFLGVGASAILRSLSIAVFIMVFGSRLGAGKALPFYEMSRLVYINQYIQRIESLFILVWVIVGLLFIAVNLSAVLYLLTRLTSIADFRPLIPAVTFIAAGLGTLPSRAAGFTNLEYTVYTTFNLVGIFIIPLLLFAAFLFRQKGKKPCFPAQ